MCQVVLGIEIVPAWVMHKLAIVTDAEVLEVAWVGAAVVVAVVAIIDTASVITHWLAFDAIVVVVGAAVIAVHGLDVAIRGGVVILGNLRLLQLHYQGHIANSNS